MTEILIIGFLLGTSIGSFLNVCAYRIPRGISVARGRSFCPDCKRTLRWFELIPIVSFLVCRGKCLACHNEISMEYPIIEFICGAIFVLVLSEVGLSFASMFVILFLYAMLLIGLIDWHHYLIPNKVLLCSLGLAIVLKAATSPNALLPGFVAMASSFFIALIIQLLGRVLLKTDALGMGDVKLAAFIGFGLELPAMLFSLWLAAVIGLAYAASLKLMATTSARSVISAGFPTNRLPFGSFLALSSGVLILIKTTVDLSVTFPGILWLTL